MPLRGLDPVDGSAIYLETHSGEGTDINAFVLQRADPIAHGKLDALKTSVDRLSLVRTTDTYVISQATRIVKTAPGKLYSFYIWNRSTSNYYYLMFFNRVDAPSAAAAFVLTPFILLPGSVLAIGSEIFGAGGINFGTGLVYGISSNEDSFTAISVPSDIRMFVTFE